MGSDDKEVGSNDKEMVREYFNNSGFQRWKKIYGDTDEVNRVQRDIRLGHAKTVENTLSMLKDEGSLQGVMICDAGCGTGSLFLWPKRAERFSSSSAMLSTSSLLGRDVVDELVARTRYWRCC